MWLSAPHRSMSFNLPPNLGELAFIWFPDARDFLRGVGGMALLLPVDSTALWNKSDLTSPQLLHFST
jgi:hypothetical protein